MIEREHERDQHPDRSDRQRRVYGMQGSGEYVLSAGIGSEDVDLALVNAEQR